MIFTDDDLKRLKDFVRNSMIRPELDPTGEESIGFKYKMEALLARLEAAEIICRRWDDDYYYEDGGLIMDWVYDDLKRWRKSKGE